MRRRTLKGYHLVDSNYHDSARVAFKDARRKGLSGTALKIPARQFYHRRHPLLHAHEVSRQSI